MCVHLLIELLIYQPEDHLFVFDSSVKGRINATTNISKITKSMKMVSASKLRGDQNRLAAGKPFAVSEFIC